MYVCMYRNVSLSLYIYIYIILIYRGARVRGILASGECFRNGLDPGQGKELPRGFSRLLEGPFVETRLVACAFVYPGPDKQLSYYHYYY